MCVCGGGGGGGGRGERIWLRTPSGRKRSILGILKCSNTNIMTSLVKAVVVVVVVLLFYVHGKHLRSCRDG